MKSAVGLRRGAVAALAAAAWLCAPAFANVYVFPATGSLDGKPVDVSASFTTGPNSVSVTLTNLQANPISIIQAISDIFFTATQGGVALTSGTGTYEPTGTYINIADDKTVTAGANPAGGWGLSNNAGVYHLDILCGKGNGCSGPAGLIIGPGPYTSANGSIAGNKPHNPFADQTASFTLALTGATADTVISNVAFSFGTDGALIPIPAAVWLFGSGLLGLAAIARRKHATQRNLPAAA